MKYIPKETKSVSVARSALLPNACLACFQMAHPLPRPNQRVSRELLQRGNRQLHLTSSPLGSFQTYLFLPKAASFLPEAELSAADRCLPGGQQRCHLQPFSLSFGAGQQPR